LRRDFDVLVLHDLQALGSLAKIWPPFSDTWDRFKFNPKKYELIYLTRASKKFNIEASVVINDKKVEPSSNISILGVRIDSTLK
jgi:hypothetical protein